jgi:hypothetical protein
MRGALHDIAYYNRPVGRPSTKLWNGQPCTARRRADWKGREPPSRCIARISGLFRGQLEFSARLFHAIHRRIKRWHSNVAGAHLEGAGKVF